jgi:hypothetical protein
MINKDIINNFMERYELTSEELDSIITEAICEIDLDEELNEMAASVRGFQYESEVVAVLAAAGAAGNITSGAGASACACDADININGEIYDIEVKLNSLAQMGGTSFTYSPSEQGLDKFNIVSASVDEDSLQMFKEVLLRKVADFDKFLAHVGAEKFPLTILKDRWVDAKQHGLLRPLNVKVKRDTSFIVQHYKKKNVDYMQIGGAGLFYLGDNPANLPVPKLEGEINLEIRAGRSGSRTRADGTVVVGGGIRIQGRLQFKGNSDYTLDDPESVKELLKSVKQTNK